MTAYPAAAQLAAVQSRPSCTFENDHFRHSHHQNDEGQLGGEGTRMRVNHSGAMHVMHIRPLSTLCEVRTAVGWRGSPPD